MTSVALPRPISSPKAVAWGGIVVALVGLWLALPPWTVRTPVPSLVLCLGALGCGIHAARSGARQEGWWAILAAVLAGLLAFQATQAQVGTLDDIISAGLFAATLRWATPLTFGAIGGLFSERTGVVNIGLEGAMLFGAFFAVWGAAETGNWFVGVLAALAIGALVGLLHAVFCVHLRADQIVVGTAVNLLALGVTSFLLRKIYGFSGTPAELDQIPNVSIPLIRDIPFVGDVIGDMNLLIWVGLATVPLAWLIIFRTPLGLRMRAVGENPRAAETVGIGVYLIRDLGVVVSGMLAALGGAYLSLAFTGSFNEGMTAGRGFIALAVLILGKWRPFPILASALLFGFASALADRLGSVGISADLLKGLPYIVTLIALVGFIGRSTAPAADGKPYVRGGA